MPESIYIVWNTSKGIPFKRHDTVESARGEARRLCEENHGHEFFVARVIESVKFRRDPYETKMYGKSK